MSIKQILLKIWILPFIYRMPKASCSLVITHLDNSSSQSADLLFFHPKK